MRSIAHWSALYGLSVSCHAYKRQDGTKPWNTGLPGQRIIDASSSSCIQFPRRYCTDEGNQCNKGGNLDAVCILFLRIFFSTGHSSGIQLEATSPQFVCWTPASRVLVDQLEVRRHSYRELLEAEIFALSTVPTPYNWITFLMQMILRRTSMLSRLGCNLIMTGSPAKSNMIIPTLTHTPMC